ncbi:hypothetical protein DEU56DRAFT_519367 [Suillus clintonianus]|uniref:uncharacterized protein n=1 Tax=Suillus clintonianus TaxID=1904413 RepID=UPI001B8640BA|nr:uncharacterized protein DEU56DRAFT_940542 [Suillus clintonianus]XP_041212103.1 uncharacterized protein DEU56DRAFT_111502 [Suillus clintonianus]XP_041213487.1 uncharacterized protein DEU56DRAFT_519367 [Suillus clintonianus]KAG0692090.1 hypothetical protein DFH29DRAFT_1052146 [Suillus ampliporus]KAG0696102.1 hypothetical protein DFH29DRAFT_1028440 [Suillus ampliporus]KAG2108598.1 hypothetical protein DEU56DRAFT_940542 [Suillus clintonianus]KAG2148135.1 hypothetical protein DEU56DRAFT_111502 
MSNLLSESVAETPILDPTQHRVLIAAVQAKYGPEIVALIVQRIFPTLSLPPGTSLVQTLIPLGPDITSDPDTVCALLQRFGISDANPPGDAQLVEIVGSIGRGGYNSM